MGNRRKSGNSTDMWKVNNILKKNQNTESNGLKKIAQEKLENTLRLMKMEVQHTKTWDAVKTVLRRKFIAVNAYIEKERKSQINNLSFHFKELEKEEQTKLKATRRKENKD